MQANLTQLTNMEQNLSSFFRPIDPDPDFINTLNRRLSRSDRTVLGQSTKNYDGLIWLGLGFLIGAIVWRLFSAKR